jgi:localization factor PodJL
LGTAASGFDGPATDEIMKKAGPWNIDGIKPDIRETAREAARRQGLSLGAWLNNVIIEQALELGIDAREMDSNARLEAVAARLHQLDDEDDVPIAPARMRSNRAMRDDRWPECRIASADRTPKPCSTPPSMLLNTASRKTSGGQRNPSRQSTGDWLISNRI